MQWVLAVDDEPALLTFLRSVLERAGFGVLVAQNGTEALTLLETHEVNLLLTDLVMPHMSGPELIKEARRRYPGLAVCCMSGYVAEPDPVLEELPIIAKPFMPDQLTTALRLLLSARPEPPLSDLTATLRERLEHARAEWMLSRRAIDQLISEVPTGTPGPDGAFRLQAAGRKRAAAFRNYSTALKAYEDAVGPVSETGQGLPGSEFEHGPE